MTSNNLNGLEKAAVLLMQIGTAAAAEIFKHLTDEEVEKLSTQIIRMQQVDLATAEAVLAEFQQVSAEGEASPTGGREFAEQVLLQSVGPEKAGELLDRLSATGQGRQLRSLAKMSAERLARSLQNEDAQVVALVLAHLEPEKAAAVLSGLEETAQAEVGCRICTMGRVDPEVLAAVEEGLHTRLQKVETSEESPRGPDLLVEILNNAEQSTERTVLGSLKEHDPAMGEEIRKRMFVLEDLPRLDDRAVQLVLREVDQEDLRLTLKGASEEVSSLIFRNMSDRAAEMLREDLELASSARPRDIEAAQQRMVRTVRRLLASGDISLTVTEEEGAVEQPDQVQIAA